MSGDNLLFWLTGGLYTVALFNCYKVIGSRVNSGSAMAWILLHLTMPFIGIPLYFLFGDFRIRGYVKKHRKRSKKLAAETKHSLPTLVPESIDVAPAIRPKYGPFKMLLDRFGPVYAPQYGEIQLLVDGSATFNAIFHAIKNARKYILVQYYIVRSDRMGLELKRLLIEKARSGVPVYMLLDDMGSFWLSRDYIQDLKSAGVHLARFLPIASFKRFFQANFRNHRKLVVVDGVTAFTGGLNIGEEYAASRSKKSMKRYWRDTHMKVSGGAVYQFEEVFLDDWYFATNKKVELPDVDIPPPADTTTQPVVQVVPTGPTDEVLVSVLLTLQLINAAQEKLWIATPYFVPDPAIIRALELASFRGVDVRIMLPQESDNRFVHWVSLSYAEQLRHRGVQILLYQPGFMHQKVILVDDTVSCIGTMNLDNRAMYLNFETMAVIHSEQVTAQVKAMLEKDFLSCRYVQKHTNSLKFKIFALRGNLARLLAPLL
jgi:cardiolipin synthase